MKTLMCTHRYLSCFISYQAPRALALVLAATVAGSAAATEPVTAVPASDPLPAPPANLPSVALPSDLARVLTDYETAWGLRTPRGSRGSSPRTGSFSRADSRP